MTTKSDVSHASAPHPSLADVGIISLVPDVWGGPWQPRHHILTRLSRYFNVVWCNPPWYWRKFRRRHRARRRRIDYGSALVPGLTIYQPEPWLPAAGRPAVLARFTMRERLLRARRLLQQTRLSDDHPLYMASLVRVGLGCDGL